MSCRKWGPPRWTAPSCRGSCVNVPEPRSALAASPSKESWGTRRQRPLGRYAPEEDLQVVVERPEARPDAGPRHHRAPRQGGDTVVVADEGPEPGGAVRVRDARRARVEAGDAHPRLLPRDSAACASDLGDTHHRVPAVSAGVVQRA